MSEEERDVLQQRFYAMSNALQAIFEQCSELGREYSVLCDEQMYVRLDTSLETALDLAYNLADYIGVASDQDWRGSDERNK